MRKAVTGPALVVLILTSTSCDIGSVTLGDIKTGPTVVEKISVPAPDGRGTSEVEISMGGGGLSIGVGDLDGLVEGAMTYNVEDVEPTAQTGGRYVLEGEGPRIGNCGDRDAVAAQSDPCARGARAVKGRFTAGDSGSAGGGKSM